jgi:hypothetical protein
MIFRASGTPQRRSALTLLGASAARVSQTPLQLSPSTAFAASRDVTSALPLCEIERDERSFAPVGSTTASGPINFDGILKTSNINKLPSIVAYV